MRTTPRIARLLATLVAGAAPVVAQGATMADPAIVDGRGPYNLSILEGGIGTTVPLSGEAIAVANGRSWSLTGWISPETAQKGFVPLVAIGDAAGACRCVGLENGRLVFRSAGGEVKSSAAIPAGRWTAIGLVADGRTVSLFVDGRKVAPMPPSRIERL